MDRKSKIIGYSMYGAIICLSIVLGLLVPYGDFTRRIVATSIISLGLIIASLVTVIYFTFEEFEDGCFLAIKEVIKKAFELGKKYVGVSFKWCLRLFAFSFLIISIPIIVVADVCLLAFGVLVLQTIVVITILAIISLILVGPFTPLFGVELEISDTSAIISYIIGGLATITMLVLIFTSMMA